MVGVGEAREKRSPMPLLAAGGLFMVVVAGGEVTAEEKSPQSAPKLSFRAVAVGCGGGGVCFGGGVGFMSKKLPPLSDDLVIEGPLEWPMGDVRPENGDALAACCSGGEVKESEPKASPSPPSACALD